MKKLLIPVMFFLLASESPVFAQNHINADTILSICKQNADFWLKKKVDSDFGDPQENMRKAYKIATLKSYSLEVSHVNSRLMKLIKSGKMQKKDIKTVIQVTFDEYQKFIPDLNKEFYEKTLLQLKDKKLKG